MTAPEEPDHCGHTIETARFTWTCIRPPHDWAEPSGPKTLRRRRNQGTIPGPDRHVYVTAP